RVCREPFSRRDASASPAQPDDPRHRTPPAKSSTDPKGTLGANEGCHAARFLNRARKNPTEERTPRHQRCRHPRSEQGVLANPSEPQSELCASRADAKSRLVEGGEEAGSA